MRRGKQRYRATDVAPQNECAAGLEPVALATSLQSLEQEHAGFLAATCRNEPRMSPKPRRVGIRRER
jgi:hypothetical protein